MSSTPLNDLAKRLFDATAWTQDLRELNSAIQPYLSGELTLDALNQEIASAQHTLAKLKADLDAKEQAILTVDTRLTLAEDARKQRVDIDFAAYRESIASQQRALDAELNTRRSALTTLDESIVDKKSALADLSTELEEQHRTLSALKQKTAALVSDITKAAGVSDHAQP